MRSRGNRNTSEKTEQDGSASPPNLKGEVSPMVDFLAAGIVSSISKVIVHPMETKIVLIAIGEATDNPMLLWHGVVMQAMTNFLYNGLLWFLKERVRPPAPDPSEPDKRPPASFFAAFFVACFTIILVQPLTTILVGMQASLKDRGSLPLSASQVASNIMSEHGIAGFFSGIVFSIALRFGSALTLVIYDSVRLRMPKVLGQDFCNFVAGLLGRLADVYACHPLKTLRSRQQTGKVLVPDWTPSALLGMWAGVGTMAIADAVKIGVRFLLIERTRTFLQACLTHARRPSVPSKDKVRGKDKVDGAMHVISSLGS